jgi:spermidine synthase
MKPTGRHIIAEFIYCSKSILNDIKRIEEILESGIKECGLDLKKIDSYQFDPVGVTSIAIIGESHIAIHTYPEALHASVDIFTCASGSEASFKLLNFLKNKFRPKSIRNIEVTRGNPLEIASNDWITSFSPDSVEVRYHVKRRFLDKKSKYQHIEIIENENYGRMLFLDKDPQVAEKDVHIYNETIVPPFVKSKAYMNNVAILGGGDGGVLNEILKANPKSVVLVDIDEEVIKYSKKFLRPICKNAFDDSRVKIVIDEVNNFLLEKNLMFDVIIYDLHMHPEAYVNIDREVYISRLLSRIKKKLNKGWILRLQCCSKYDTKMI